MSSSNWEIVNGAKFPVVNNPGSWGEEPSTEEKKTFIHEGKEWTTVKEISLEEAIAIVMGQKDSRK